MPKPIIGITTYGRDESNKFPLPAEYVDSVRRAGGIPVLIPSGESDFAELLEHLDGVVLAGGGDIDPARYDGKMHETIYMLDEERDRSELALTKHLLETEKPTLAICRGMQIVNVLLGGSLYPHLPEIYGDEINHRLPPREPTPHPVTLEPGCKLSKLMQAEECEISSWHHQSVKETGAGLNVVAKAADGVIEALELPFHPWFYAVQWHPELTAARDPIQQRLFDELVKVASKTN